MAKIISVSIGINQYQFLMQTKLSPSAILQRSIDEIMARNKVSPEYVEQLRKNISFMQDTIKKQGNFIDKRGLMQEYLNFENV